MFEISAAPGSKMQWQSDQVADGRIKTEKILHSSTGLAHTPNENKSHLKGIQSCQLSAATDHLPQFR
jgi:hypothetical protein